MAWLPLIFTRTALGLASIRSRLLSDFNREISPKFSEHAIPNCSPIWGGNQIHGLARPSSGFPASDMCRPSRSRVLPAVRPSSRPNYRLETPTVPNRRAVPDRARLASLSILGSFIKPSWYQKPARTTRASAVHGHHVPRNAARYCVQGHASIVWLQTLKTTQCKRRMESPFCLGGRRRSSRPTKCLLRDMRNLLACTASTLQSPACRMEPLPR